MEFYATMNWGKKAFFVNWIYVKNDDSYSHAAFDNLREILGISTWLLTSEWAILWKINLPLFLGYHLAFDLLAKQSSPFFQAAFFIPEYFDHSMIIKNSYVSRPTSYVNIEPLFSLQNCPFSNQKHCYFTL